MRSTLVLLIALASTPATTGAERPLVFAAASLTEALREAGAAFTRKTGREVDFSFAGSSDLARQIELGAPADLFFSADLAQVERLEREGLIRRTERTDLLSNGLVVVVPSDATLQIDGPADLARCRLIALADPEAVPAGVYARRYLEARGLWTSLSAKIVPALDVRAALAAAAGGHVDAAIVYRTDAATSERVRVAFTVPRAEGPAITYALALLAEARAGARELYEFLVSPESRAICERHGFVVLDSRPAE